MRNSTLATVIAISCLTIQSVSAQAINAQTKNELRNLMSDELRAQARRDEEQRAKESRDSELANRAVQRANTANSLSPSQQSELDQLDRARRQETKRELEAAQRDVNARPRTDQNIYEWAEKKRNAKSKIENIKGEDDYRAQQDLSRIMREGSSNQGATFGTSADMALGEQLRAERAEKRAKAERDRKPPPVCVIKPAMTNAEIEICRNEK